MQAVEARIKEQRGETWAGKSVVVLGLARSGLAAGRLLLAAGARPLLCDRKGSDELGEPLQKLLAEGARYIPESVLVQSFPRADAVILSPGIAVDAPLVQAAQRQGIQVLSEVELAWRFVRGQLFAVTGTNGKTTTVSWLGEMLRQAGRVVHVAGNIGHPLSAAVLAAGDEDSIVAEISSFQMETVSTLSPDYAAVLNLTPDHLDRHLTMERYSALKRQLLLGQAATGYSVLNWDCQLTRRMAVDLPGKVAWFSSREPVDTGTFVHDGRVFYRGNGQESPLCEAEEISLPGKHNLENALAAACMAALAGVQPVVIRHALRSFAGVEHRLELAAEQDGVRYYNDSKGTNPDSTIKAVEAMTAQTHLIAGGHDKMVSFTGLAVAIKASGTVRQVVLYGETAPKIKAALMAAGYDAIVLVGTMQEALAEAYACAQAGECVLFSPACSSFDQFNDYEQRGRLFKQAVRELFARGQQEGGHGG